MLRFFLSLKIKAFMKYLNLLFFIFVFSTAALSQHQTDLKHYLPQNVTYNKEIPTPESIIGHPVGKWHITHDKLLQYMRELAKSSNRITIEDRGLTFEDRPLILLTITSPKNHKNISEIRNAHTKATESDTNNTSNRPIVVYQGFSIHGNEPSGSNASLLAAYYLAAAQGSYINKLLDNTIILFDPSLNPDGLQRFSYWANTNKNLNITTDPDDREYHEGWPSARTNHYWFDMNRDWLPVQLPESRARIKTFHQWLPNILTDHHEMGTNSTFFFQPGIPSRTHPLTPKLNQELTAKIGDFHAKAFDKIGSLYYTQEDYDDFYYGKGSTFPDINGGIGILFEQASSRGHAQQTDNGLLTFPFTIKNQLTAALSTLDAALNMRETILNYQHTFYQNARKEALKEKSKAIVFGNPKDAARTYHLAEILQHHKIKFHDIKENFTSNGKTFKKGNSYIIPKNQKNNRLIKAMFEKRVTFQDSLFYDISAWTFPLAFNLDYDNSVPVNHIGNEVTSLSLKKGGVTKKSDYAYLLEWHEYYTPKILNQLLSKNIRVKVSLQQFKTNNKTYDYGTILIPVQNQNLNNTALYNTLNKLAIDSHLSIDGADTGLTSGIDLGSRLFKTITQPKIGLLVGEGIRSYDAGEIWHLLDTRYNISPTKIDINSLNYIDLNKYNVIIMASANFNTPIAKKIKNWVANGGTLIAYRNALKAIKKHEIVNFDIKVNKPIASNTITFEQKSNFNGAQVIGGAIFNTKIDRSHPINFGYTNDHISLFRNTTIFMNPDKKNYNNPIKYTKNPLLSGYISKPNLDSLSNTVPLQIKALGKGQVVGFTDNTNFRAFWYGTNKLLMNAIFFRELF